MFQKDTELIGVYVKGSLLIKSEAEIDKIVVTYKVQIYLPNVKVKIKKKEYCGKRGPYYLTINGEDRDGKEFLLSD